MRKPKFSPTDRERHGIEQPEHRQTRALPADEAGQRGVDLAAELTHRSTWSRGMSASTRASMRSQS